MCRWLAYPDNPRLAGVSEETRLVVSEPLVDEDGRPSGIISSRDLIDHIGSLAMN